MNWDLFCRVVDNFGDAGVCWRLAGDLATRGQAVRLWIDDASCLAWMAPGGAPNVQVRPWREAAAALDPADVVVEAFGCDLPPAFVARMAAGARHPLWINLEYLSAEAYVERCHGLRSPQLSGPGLGLDKWFFYPGFSARTGGLIRETDLMQRRQAFDGAAWLSKCGWPRRPTERVVSVFCYDNPALAGLIDELALQPTLLLVAPGAAARRLASALGPTLARGAARAVLLPWLSQRDYDHLLWACDLNFVRGEDSLVRAMWAGAPFVWQAYPQADGAHLAKLHALLDRMLGDASAELAAALRRLWSQWNSGGAVDVEGVPAKEWHQLTRRWRDTLLAQGDLGSQLLGFAREQG